MAEGWTRTVRCRYFANGICREGERCRYLHEGPSGPGPGPVPNLGMSHSQRNIASSSSTCCRYFQRGMCTFGNNCRFSHALDAPTTSVNADSTASSQSLNIPISTSEPEPGTSRKITILKKGQSADSNLAGDTSGCPEKPSTMEKPATTQNWVLAPEFVPAAVREVRSSADNVPAGRKSYAEVCNPVKAKSDISFNKLCPFLEVGECHMGNECVYVHGLRCEFCERRCLHPTDTEQNKKHRSECLKEIEHDMEVSFAIARSKDKTCGICFEIIMEKAPREQRFGILPNCNHCFCLSCIRKWRQAKQFENKIIRSCPECRVTSDFVCPSVYWVETSEEKEKLIKDYHAALSVKSCKYFKEGRGKCPFGNKCFYLHALPDGTKADVGPPVRQRRHNADGEIDVLQSIILWDFIDDRENRWLYTIDELEDLVTFFSDSDESEWSEYDLFFD